MLQEMCDEEETLKAEKQERLQNQYWSLLIFVWGCNWEPDCAREIWQQNEKDTISIDSGQGSFRLIENVAVLGREIPILRK